jgi:hypothetical protein
MTALVATTAADTSDWTFRMAMLAVEVDALSQFTTDWEIITAEDIVYKRNLKRRIQAAIMTAAESISRWQCDEDADEDENADEDVETEATSSASHVRPRPTQRNQEHVDAQAIHRIRPRYPHNAVLWLEEQPNCVLNLLFPSSAYHLLQDRGWLPETFGNHRLTYELDLNHLIVHLASPAHDAAANAFNFPIVFRSSNYHHTRMTLRQLGEASWQYALGAQKSPDQSWYPIGLSIPPAFVIPGTLNCPYPTIVLEVSKTNEIFQQLLDDATLKHFSVDTSVQIWIGAKLFPGHGGRFKAMFRLRDQVNGGVLAGSGAQTDFLPLNQPTNVEFIIPKARVFWGLNPPLPPTCVTVPGPNALPAPPVPGVGTDDLVLQLENLRDAAFSCW